MIETDHSSYAGSDDDTVIETDQPLFLDAVPVCKFENTCIESDGGALGISAEDDVAMAEFLQVTFDSNVAAGSEARAGAATTLEGVMDTDDMDELLMAENEALMLFPDLELEN